MWKTREIPMPVLVSDESDKEENYGDVNAMQSEDICYFCKQPSHQMRSCKKYEEWRKKNPPSNVSYFNCRNYSRSCKDRQSNWGRSDGNRGGGRVADLEKTVADLTDKLNKVAGSVFSERNQFWDDGNTVHR